MYEKQKSKMSSDLNNSPFFFLIFFCFFKVLLTTQLELELGKAYTLQWS